MNIVLLYLLMLKGTATAFAGLASLPVIHDALVTQFHVLTNEQLNEAVVITRSTPGPVGLYIVSVGYFVSGVPGAIAGWLAMITPALLIIPLLHFAGRHIERTRVKGALQAVVIASAGLLLAASIPLAQAALTDWVAIAIARRQSYPSADNRTRYALDHPRCGAHLPVGLVVWPDRGVADILIDGLLVDQL
jgi:chromate transporter